jgi:effector-binding domain-containing protein
VQKKLQSIHGLMAVESKLDGVSLIASYRVEPQAHCPNTLTQGTKVHIEVPMVRSDATTSTLLDTTKPRRSFYLQGFTHAERPESKETHQIVIDYLEDQGLDAVGQSTEADILVVREVTQVQCITAVIKPLSYCSTLSYSSLLSEPICTTLIRILCGFSLALLSKCMLGRLGLVEA